MGYGFFCDGKYILLFAYKSNNIDDRNTKNVDLQQKQPIYDTFMKYSLIRTNYLCNVKLF